MKIQVILMGSDVYQQYTHEMADFNQSVVSQDPESRRRWHPIKHYRGAHCLFANLEPLAVWFVGKDYCRAEVFDYTKESLKDFFARQVGINYA